MLQKKTMVMKIQIQEESKEEEKDQDEVLEVFDLFRSSVYFTYFPFGNHETIAKQNVRVVTCFGIHSFLHISIWEGQGVFFTYFLFGKDNTLAKKK